MKFSMSPAPFLRRKRTTLAIMLELTIALALVWLASIIYYFTIGTNHGLQAILIGVVSTVTMMLVEFLFYLPKCIKDGKEAVSKNSELNCFKETMKAMGYKLSHSFGWVSGLILALLLPVGTPLYVVVVSAIIAILVGKLLFGGFGYNIFNPAIVGRIFAQLCFGTSLAYGVEESVSDFTIFTGATITSQLSNNNWMTTGLDIDLWKLLLGNYQGTLGETFTLLILVIGVVLAIRKVIDWKVPVFYVGTLYLASLLAGLCGGYGLESFEYALIQISIGGIMFGAVFCLTDPVTNPTSPSGKVIFAVGAALFTFVIRYFASAPEGVAYSILLMNMITPLIDRCIKGFTTKKLLPKWGVIGGIMLASMVLGVSSGFVNHGAYDAEYRRQNEFSSVVEKVEDNVYHVEVEQGEKGRVWSKIEMKVTLDMNNRTVTKIEVLSYGGNGGFGDALLTGGEIEFSDDFAYFGDKNKALAFYDKYIKLDSPLSFDEYLTIYGKENSIGNWSSEAKGVIRVGATYTTMGFIYGVCEVINYAGGAQ